MIRRLLSLAAMLIMGLVIYNLMFGEEADKENAKQITSGIKDLMKSTKEKYKNGEYNEAIDKIGDVFKQLKGKAETLDNKDYLKELSELEERKQRLEEMLEALEAKENSQTRSLVPQDHSKEKAAIQQELLELEQKTGNLAERMDQQ